MKNRLFTGVIFIVIGLVIAIGLHTFLPVCGEDMKCHQTAQAETGVGVIIALYGVALLAAGSNAFRQGISVAGIFTGIFAVLIANVLIGVCGGAHMGCRKVTLPVLTILSSIIVVVSVINFAYLYRKREESDTHETKVINDISTVTP